MKRRSFIKMIPVAGTAGIFNPVTFEGYLPNPGIADPSDRAYWVNLLMRISEPVIKNIANNTLKKVMPVEKAAGYRGNPAEVAHLEAFGRTVAGLAPWLTLADDATQEGKLRKRMRNDTLQGITNAVDPAAPDYLNFRTQAQPMVDAAYCIRPSNYIFPASINFNFLKFCGYRSVIFL